MSTARKWLCMGSLIIVPLLLAVLLWRLVVVPLTPDTTLWTISGVGVALGNALYIGAGLLWLCGQFGYSMRR